MPRSIRFYWVEMEPSGRRRPSPGRPLALAGMAPPAMLARTSLSTRSILPQGMRALLCRAVRGRRRRAGGGPLVGPPPPATEQPAAGDALKRVLVVANHGRP